MVRGQVEEGWALRRGRRGEERRERGLRVASYYVVQQGVSFAAITWRLESIAEFRRRFSRPSFFAVSREHTQLHIT